MNKRAFWISILIAGAWMVTSIILSLPWLSDLTNAFGFAFALFAITFIAYIPGFTNFFIAASLLLEKKKSAPKLEFYPPVSILIAAYNEEKSIGATLISVLKTKYSGAYEVLHQHTTRVHILTYRLRNRRSG